MACYYRNGTRAVDDTPCPNANTCCPSGATCMDNLLCRDKNNHPNGSLTVFPDGHSYNYTGLYYTPSCQDKSYKGCSVACTTYDSYRGQYIWACNAALTEYCCHNDEAGLGQADCCDGGTFELPAPGSGSSSASASASASTSTPVSSTSTTTTSSSTLASAPSESGTPSTTAAATAAATASLSTGAKAGIGIGAAGAGIIIIVLVALLLRARRLAAVNRGPSQTEKNTFWASGARTRATQAELEACADAPPSELSAKPAPNRFELAS
ncbi:hypothetical protein KXV22_001717 [Aspergillus fumigatus]|nr:hypothetical protein KXV45_001059 [Aspergillus fumigatus]KAH2591539.1 hypothetical protein KXV63_008187 [Aspergillus fumigatus]KAH2871873.1 hypothetical protein KXV31_001398 [Aspergillus fumigatus]KAH2954228.1 hypothetical protein KXW00_001249 [Aspergillus fumigatus]KAH3111584.1 hypothetical protein KXX00_001783 [Aspergillus fumigatus]